MSSMTLDELHGHLADMTDDEVILDVRTPEEFAEGHIAGAINISHTEVGERLDELSDYTKVYIICKRGGRAKQAFSEAQCERKGFYCIYDAGMDAWQERGYPVTQ